MKTLDEGKLNVLVRKISLRFFGKPFKHKARYNSRLRTTGGRYLLNDHTIELNPKYILEMDEEDYIGIIKHELCHYHLHIEGKGYKHGDKDFRELLSKTGAPRHCKPLPSMRNRKRHIYKCAKCNYIYRRVRRININKYRCGKCRGEITFLEKKESDGFT